MHHHINDAHPKEEHTQEHTDGVYPRHRETHPLAPSTLAGRTDAPAFGQAPRLHAPSTQPAVQSAVQSVVQPSPHQAGSSDICEQIREHLSNTLGPNRVRRYLSGTVSMTHTETNIIEIVAGDRFTLDMIERRLSDPLRIAAQFALGTTDPIIVYRVDGARHKSPKLRNGRDAHAESSPSNKTSTHPLANRIQNPHTAIGRSTRFPPCPSLKDFLVGSSNRLAYESVKQVLQSGIDSPPVFVHGACGVGKTHLLRGATQYARQLRPGCKVRYTTGEGFTNGFVTAIRSRTIEVFKKKFKGLDLLCIDDIHLMAGKQATQHELLQIFNTLSLGGAKIILASDAHPREIARLDQALSSRFAAGLVVKVEVPDLELAPRLVAHIAAKRGIFLDGPAIQTIVDRVGVTRGASVRDLEGAIVQIQAVARLMDRSKTTSSTRAPDQTRSNPLTPSMTHIRKALSLRDGRDASRSTGPIALDSIIARICQEMTVSKSDLIGKGRQKKVVMARELIVHTARNLTSKSFPEIAYAIGRPNHSTVITAAKRFKGRVNDGQTIEVGCPHDGLPAGELAEIMARQIRS